MASAEENTGCVRTKLLSFLFLFQLRALVVITGQLSNPWGKEFDDAENIILSEHIGEGAVIVVGI